MKKYIIFVIGMIYLMAGLAVMAQPRVGDSFSGAVSFDDQANKKLAGNGGYIGGVVEARVVPILGKPLDPKTGWLDQITIQSDWINVPEWVPVIRHNVSWKNLVYAEKNGVPTTDWSVVQQLVHLKSIDRSDSISISMVSMQSTETPTGVLSDFYYVRNKTYGPAAIGIKADGTRVTGGPSNQMVSEIILIFQMRMFIGETKSTLDEVRDWVLSKDQYTLNYKIWMEGREVLGGEAQVTVQKPYLTITKDHVTLQGDEPEYTYDIQYAQQVTGPWKILATVWPGDRVAISTTDKAKFFRATPR